MQDVRINVPSLVDSLSLPIVPLAGPNIALADGHRGFSEGAVELTAVHPTGQATGKVLVTDMCGVNLLLGCRLLADRDSANVWVIAAHWSGGVKWKAACS